MPTARVFAEIIAALGTFSSLGFYLLSACGIASFLRAHRSQQANSAPKESSLPPVSILKPLKGIDPHLWEALSSHCEQDYPDFQIIFGVSDPDDPAIAVVRQLQEKYPAQQIELVIAAREDRKS